MEMKKSDIPKFTRGLLAHYAAHGRALPWRGRVGDSGVLVPCSPYEIWVSEIMLQQTQVAAVVGYYNRFLAKFPTVFDLAGADEEEVIRLWEGLGYYSRARNLLKCARVVVDEWAGKFPETEEALQKLPGIGPYTAAAVASMAFNKPAAVVDGNVERVMARLYKVEEALPLGKKILRGLAEKVAVIGQDTAENCAAYSNAIMDFGATACTPKKPLCGTCFARNFCAVYDLGEKEVVRYPRRLAKVARPERVGEVYVLRDELGRLFLVKRPSSGLLGGLWAFPSCGWDRADDVVISDVDWEDAGEVVHVFTHFKLTLTVRVGILNAACGDGFFEVGDLPPMSTLMRKVLGLV